MTLVDQFESVFRSAERERFEYERMAVGRVLFVTDFELADADALTEEMRRYLVEIDEDGAWWKTLSTEDYDDVDSMLERIDEEKPDLIVTYRDLRSETWKWPYSLGVYLNVLTRETEYPVLVLPNPREFPDKEWAERDTSRVMVLADHLTGDHRLVNWGVRFARAEGKLFLAHVEDDSVFERYSDLIGKIPSIDTTVAQKDIRLRLLKEPEDYIESCREVLSEQGHLTHEVVPIVKMGHRLDDYLAMIDKHKVDLLVFHAVMEGEDLALDGKAYSLGVKLRDVPILML